MAAATKLYFFAAEGFDGSDLDWFVEAESVEQARELYREEVEKNWSNAESLRVFEVPALSGKPSVVGWGTIDGDVKQVYEERDDQ